MSKKQKGAKTPSPAGVSAEQSDNQLETETVEGQPTQTVEDGSGDAIVSHPDPVSDTPAVAATLIAQVPSETTEGLVYDVHLQGDGSVSCTCQSWIHSSSTPKSCKHLAALAGEGEIDAIYAAAAKRPSTPPPAGESEATDKPKRAAGSSRGPRKATAASVLFTELRRRGYVCGQEWGETPTSYPADLAEFVQEREAKKRFVGTVFSLDDSNHEGNFLLGMLPVTCDAYTSEKSTSQIADEVEKVCGELGIALTREADLITIHAEHFVAPAPKPAEDEDEAPATATVTQEQVDAALQKTG